MYVLNPAGPIKDKILKERRRRIRKTTYDYVARVIEEDTRFDHPHRDRMVIDWWHRIVDPLEAEGYDKRRLAYFRERLLEHRAAPHWNSTLRQGEQSGKPKRRLTPKKFAYVTHQIRRLADRKLNYAAAETALSKSDIGYRQLVIGLLALPYFQHSPKRLLERASSRAASDNRFKALVADVQTEPEHYVPGRPAWSILNRIDIISDSFHRFWFDLPTMDYLTEFKYRGLIKKIEDEYLSKIS